MRQASFDPVFEKQLKKLDYSIREMVIKRMEKIKMNPELGKPLQGHLKNHFSERIEQFRIIYTFNSEVVEFIYLENRDKVYVPHTFNDADGIVVPPIVLQCG